MENTKLYGRILELLRRNIGKLGSDLVGQRQLPGARPRLDVAQHHGQSAGQIGLQIVRADTQRLWNAHQVPVEREDKLVKSTDGDAALCTRVISGVEIPTDTDGRC